MTTNSFGVVGPTVTVTIRTVCYAISEHLLPKYIHLPQDKPSLERLIAGWEPKTGFQMVVGCSWWKAHPHHATIPQLTRLLLIQNEVHNQCARVFGKFIDVGIRWPGGTHDAKVFSYSSINKHLQEQKQPYLCRPLLPGRDKVVCYCLGILLILFYLMWWKSLPHALLTLRLYSIRCCEMPGMQ